MNLSKKDRENLVHALQVVRVRMQEDALSAILYNSQDFGRVVMSKIEEFMDLSERISAGEQETETENERLKKGIASIMENVDPDGWAYEWCRKTLRGD